MNIYLILNKKILIYEERKSKVNKNFLEEILIKIKDKRGKDDIYHI